MGAKNPAKAGALIGRLAIAWSTVTLFFLFGDRWLADLSLVLRAASLFIWLFAVILWCAFGVVREADHLAELLGEPLGTLVLTLSIVIIEVVLIGAVALGSDAAATLGRDTMFAVLMIVLNGAVGPFGSDAAAQHTYFFRTAHHRSRGDGASSHLSRLPRPDL
jgi:Ca2+/H+ antiporter